VCRRGLGTQGFLGWTKAHVWRVRTRHGVPLLLKREKFERRAPSTGTRRGRGAADDDARERARRESDDGVVVRDGAREQWIVDAGARRGANASHGRERAACIHDDEGGGVRRIDDGEERIDRGVVVLVFVVLVFGVVIVGVDEQTRGRVAAHSRRRADAAEKRERCVRKRGGERIGGDE
jgi:hypothetical protein